MQILDKLFSFEGRLNRLAYFLYSLWLFFIFILGSLITFSPIIYKALYNEKADPLVFVACSIVLVVLCIAVAIANISIICRRLHDMDLSGCWIFAIWVWSAVCAFISYTWFVQSGNVSGVHLIGLISYLPNFLLLFVKGTEGMNRFGPDPLMNRP